MAEPGPGSARQRGWGLVVLLLAVVIVALLAGTMLRQYGLAGGSSARVEPGARGEGARDPGLGMAPLDPGAAVPAPRTAIERARGLEDSVRQQAGDLNKRVDDAAQ